MKLLGKDIINIRHKVRDIAHRTGRDKVKPQANSSVRGCVEECVWVPVWNTMRDVW